MGETYLALAHYPVNNKNGQVIAAALTTIDMHDMARLAATYGLKAFFIVTPLTDQIDLAEKMIKHWSLGAGKEYNPARAQALDLVRIARDLAEVKKMVEKETGLAPKLAATAASDGPGRTAFKDMAAVLADEQPLVLVFGTAWGLNRKALAECEIVIEPIRGKTDYNHLSVRSATGIILDRLFGVR